MKGLRYGQSNLVLYKVPLELQKQKFFKSIAYMFCFMFIILLGEIPASFICLVGLQPYSTHLSYGAKSRYKYK